MATERRCRFWHKSLSTSCKNYNAQIPFDKHLMLQVAYTQKATLHREF
jgi:hypothetical protein